MVKQNVPLGLNVKLGSGVIIEWRIVITATKKYNTRSTNKHLKKTNLAASHPVMYATYPQAKDK